MIIFLEVEDNQGKIIINCQQIAMVTPEIDYIKLVMANGETLQLNISLEEFRTLLLKYELLLDKDSHIVRPGKDTEWEIIE